jgi:hypothetical protein
VDDVAHVGQARQHVPGQHLHRQGTVCREKYADR